MSRIGEYIKNNPIHRALVLAIIMALTILESMLICTRTINLHQYENFWQFIRNMGLTGFFQFVGLPTLVMGSFSVPYNSPTMNNRFWRAVAWGWFFFMMIVVIWAFWFADRSKCPGMLFNYS
jgi:hypothetical protein